MAGRGRGRGGVTPMQRLVLDMQREIEWLTERLDNQEVQRGNEIDEDGENEDERLGEMSYEDRVLRGLEGRIEAIKNWCFRLCW